MCTLSFQVSGAEKGAKHTQAEYAAAYALLEAMQLPALLKQSFDGLVEIQLRAAPQLMPYKDVFINFFKKYVSFEALKKGDADIYFESFMVVELKEMTA